MRKSKAEKEHFASKYGTDKQYLEWLSYQPSCLDGTFNQYQDGVGRNIACHVRRSSNSGTGIKPPFSAVPMTDEQHKVQSLKGEAAALNLYRDSQEESWSVKEAKIWFDLNASRYLINWMKAR